MAVDDDYRHKRSRIVLSRYKVRSISIYESTAMSTSIDLDEIIKALANPVRREMLQWLKDPEKYFVEQDHPFEIGVCAGKFDQRCGLSQSTVSAHLATLQRAGLVTSRKVGQWHFFKRNEAVIAEFLRQMSDEL
jgi:ArsR family transcriptional regulator